MSIRETYTLVCDDCGKAAGKGKELASQAENEGLRFGWKKYQDRFMEKFRCPLCIKKLGEPNNVD